MKKNKTAGGLPGFVDLYKSIRKGLPGPTRAEEPKRGTGHSYSKRDRHGWRRDGRAR